MVIVGVQFFLLNQTHESEEKYQSEILWEASCCSYCSSRLLKSAKYSATGYQVLRADPDSELPTLIPRQSSSCKTDFTASLLL